MLALTVVIFLLLFGLLAGGVPVGFAMGVAGVIGLLTVGGTSTLLGILGTTVLSATQSYEMVTMPMFLLMAEFVLLSGVANDLFRAAATWVRRVPGGLGIATAMAGAGFGAISGSSTASAATLSATTIPEMIKQGYEPKMACGVVAISGTLAMIIPPSIALVLFGIIGDVSIGKLLVGGVVPGILITFTIALTVYVLVLLDPRRAPVRRSYTMREKFASLKVAGPMIALFLAVTGVIYAGVATPTEASGIGAFGAFLLALRAGKINLRTLRKVAVNATGTACMIFLIIVGASIFGYFLTLTRSTQQLVAAVSAMGLAPWMVLTIVLMIYLILGCIMDQVAILILTVPIMLPVIVALGYDPVWFGVIVIVVAEVGMLTPPIGLNVFVVARYTGRPIEEIFRGVWPHVFAHLVLIVLFVLFPGIILWLPGQMK
ncbi:MAG: TRAP transporter large permease [Betaproteobacteria bacterium]|nr:TRAP transporter large permease [Betaproteobacteria bacterium]